MKLIYEKTDITSYVNITKAVHKDTCGNKTDCLEIEMDRADVWERWGPQTDDRIELIHSGYSTGTLYLNTFIPQKNKFRILATGIPSAAKRKAWNSFEGMTLNELMKWCGAECGMESELYGLEGDIRYRYLLRNDEGVAAFIQRVLNLEGAALKTINGKLCGISILYAQDLPAKQRVKIGYRQDGVTYTRRRGTKFNTLCVMTPYASATATDIATRGIMTRTITGLAAADEATAGRWSKGLLLMRNRLAETLEMETELNVGITSLARVDADGVSDASGEWIVDECEHDFVNKTTWTKMLRCIRTVR